MQEPRNRGVVYENKVKSNIQELLAKNTFPVHIMDDGGTGSFNAHDTDLRLNIAGQPVDIEIKGAKAQMGETSFRYNPDQGFAPVKENLDQSIVDRVVAFALNDLRPSLNDALDFFKGCAPVDYHQEVVRIPLTVTKSAWDAAKRAGMLSPINRKIETDEKYITDHYNSKCGGVFYIQIEKRGLFYLGENPLALPVPKFEGSMDIEVRLKFAGSKDNVSLAQKTKSATLIIAGRLKSDIKSPFSLDDLGLTKELFGLIS